MVLEQGQEVQGVQEICQEVEPVAWVEPVQEELEALPAVVALVEQAEEQEEPVVVALVEREDELVEPEEAQNQAGECHREGLHQEVLHHREDHQGAFHRRENHGQGPEFQKTFPTSPRD